MKTFFYLSFFILLLMFSCSDDESKTLKLQSPEKITTNLLGNWEINYLEYNSKRIYKKNLCNPSHDGKLSFYKETITNKDTLATVGLVCSGSMSSFVNVKGNKIKFKNVAVTLGSCPAFICSVESKLTSPFDFESYTRRIIQNSDNYDSESNYVTFSFKNSTVADTLIITDDNKNILVYFRGSHK